MIWTCENGNQTAELTFDEFGNLKEGKRTRKKHEKWVETASQQKAFSPNLIFNFDIPVKRNMPMNTIKVLVYANAFSHWHMK